MSDRPQVRYKDIGKTGMRGCKTFWYNNFPKESVFTFCIELFMEPPQLDISSVDQDGWMMAHKSIQYPLNSKMFDLGNQIVRQVIKKLKESGYSAVVERLIESGNFTQSCSLEFRTNGHEIPKDFAAKFELALSEAISQNTHALAELEEMRKRAMDQGRVA